jgi:hypothetical protein
VELFEFAAIPVATPLRRDQALAEDSAAELSGSRSGHTKEDGNARKNQLRDWAWRGVVVTKTVVGLNSVRLDADRTRDELAATLGQIRDRLMPHQIARTVGLSITARPWRFVVGALAVTALAAGIPVLMAKSNPHG